VTTRVRFAIWAGLASVAAVVVAGVVGLLVIQQSLDTEVDRRIETGLATLEAARTPEAACALVRGSSDDLQRMRSFLDRNGERCRSSAGALAPRVLGVETIGSETVDDGLRTRMVAGTPWRIASSRRIDGNVVIVAESLEAVRRTQHDATSAVLVAMGVGVLLAALVGAGAAAPATRRIERLVEAVRRAGADHSGATRVGRIGSRDLDQAGAAVDDLLDDLRSTHAAQRRLLADAAHELRTPVTSIRTNAQLLERDPSLSGDAADIARRIARQSASVASLISGLVDVAAVGAWSGSDAREVELGELASEAIERARGRWPDLEVALDADASSALVDRELVVRALGNLLDNAVTHGDGRVDMTIEANVLLVEDGGAGFVDEDVHQGAFRPFVAGSGGSGIGLAFVEHVMVAHGGSARIARRSPPQVELRFPFSGNVQVRLTERSDS